MTETDEKEALHALTSGDLWDRLADPGAAPGGGSAAAVVAGMAAALTAKAARRSSNSWSDARGVAAQAGSLAKRCTELAQEDAHAFDAALQALENPTDVALPLAQTVAVLLELGETAADVAELAARTAEHCDGTFRGDAVSATLLAEAAARVVTALVASNLTVAKGDERLLRARRLADVAAAAARRALDAGP